MGSVFVPQELHITHAPPVDAQLYSEIFGCRVLFSQSENRLFFDAAWLDLTPKLGNEITYSAVLRLCDDLLEEQQLHVGLTGKVREVLLVNLARPTGFDAVARHLKITPRTLPRKLHQKNPPFLHLLAQSP